MSYELVPSTCIFRSDFLLIFSAFRGKEIGNEKLTVILDLQQISYKNVDARGLITGFQFLQVSTAPT